MKNIIALAVAFCSALSINAQIPNAGFEDWTNTDGYNMPTGWGNLNPATTMMSVYTCTMGTPGSPGNSYLKLVSKTVTGMGVMPGIAVSGTINMNTMQPSGGFACTSRPTALKGKWQYMASGNDQGFIAVYLTKWNTNTNMRDTIGSAMNMLVDMAMSWANFNIPITYNSANTPDSAMIILSASGLTPINGSYLYVDNLSFAVPTTGINTLEETGSIKLYPNPATEQFQLDISGLKSPAKSIYITDLSGKVITYLTNASAKVNTVDISNLPIGQYLLTIQTEKGAVTQKISKQ